MGSRSCWITDWICWGGDHLGGRGYGETIKLGGGGADHVGSCASVQGQLHRVFVIEGVKDRWLDYAHTEGCWLFTLDWSGHCSHPRARTPRSSVPPITMMLCGRPAVLLRMQDKKGSSRLALATISGLGVVLRMDMISSMLRDSLKERSESLRDLRF